MALALAPADRLVLRAAARFFVHIDEGGTANDLLAKAERVRVDPWVMAAEIATAQVAGRTSRNLRRAENLLRRLSAQTALSELAAAVATEDLSNGSMRAARKNMNSALAQPTEVSFSQAVWAANEQNLQGLDLGLIPVIEANAEGPAMEAFYEGNWRQSQRHTARWQAQEPFSGRPAHLGSFIALALERDFAAASEFIENGLSARREDPILLNNRAFLLIECGDLVEARNALAEAEPVRAELPVAFAATAGLLAFREGDRAAGLHLYRSAIDLAIRERRLIDAAVATTFLVRELQRLGDERAPEVRAELRSRVQALPRQDREIAEAVEKAQVSTVLEGERPQ